VIGVTLRAAQENPLSVELKWAMFDKLDLTNAESFLGIRLSG
jgi:hypothetical protein